MNRSASDIRAGALPVATPALQCATKSSTVHGRTNGSPAARTAAGANARARSKRAPNERCATREDEHRPGAQRVETNDHAHPGRRWNHAADVCSGRCFERLHDGGGTSRGSRTRKADRQQRRQDSFAGCGKSGWRMTAVQPQRRGRYEESRHVDP